MADLALNQVSNKEVSSLSVNEYRRLSIAMELVRDPGNSLVATLLAVSLSTLVNEQST